MDRVRFLYIYLGLRGSDPKYLYRMSKKSCPFIYCDFLYENLKEFLQKLGNLYHGETIIQSAIAKDQRFQEILDCTDRLQNILDKLTDSQITEILDSNEHVIKPTQDQLLASILGFSKDLVTYLEESDNYYSNEQLVLDFLQDKEEEIEDQEFFSWEDSFKKLGFTEIKSKILGELADANPFSSHETPAQWAFRHIEQEFKYNILLSNFNHENNWNKNHEIDAEYDIPTSVDEDVVIVKETEREESNLEDYSISVPSERKEVIQYLNEKRIMK